jgi:hypothetical protein
MSDDRAERLRQSRNRAKERAQDTDGETTEAGAEQSADSDKPSKASVKDERVGTYMYLPEGQQKELSRLYNVLKAEYEYEYDTEFEKNRHFYPLVIEFGISDLDGLDASDIQDRLGSLD